MKENRKAQKIAQSVGLFSLGAMVGSLSALLFAPASGKAVRKRLGNQILQTKKQLLKKADILRDTAVEKFGDTRQWLLKQMKNGNGKHPVRHRLIHHA
ncbi:MAG: YtxH domain-containing protein [Candidatus Omnitrophica bacterium]|nr:YtxH domain-containing protein [Candidatus Omnitrophota bacterium]